MIFRENNINNYLNDYRQEVYDLYKEHEYYSYRKIGISCVCNYCCTIRQKVYLSTGEPLGDSLKFGECSYLAMTILEAKSLYQEMKKFTLERMKQNG